MAQVSFVKAQRQKSKLRLALAGVSGAGKTMTALKIASALGSKIAVIDSERGSASKYEGEPGIPEFDVLELESFSPERYIEGILAAQEAGYDVCIIDSASHAWTGKEGVLEQVDKVVARGGKGFTDGWRKASPMHNNLVDTMLQSKMHMIVTMRMKGKYILEENNSGRQSPKKVGMEMQQREGFEFEFDIVGEIDIDHQMFISKSRFSDIDGQVISKPDSAFGRNLMAWLNKGVEAVEKPRQTETEATTPPAQSEGHSEERQELLLKIQDVLTSKAGTGPASRQVKASLVEKAFGAHVKAWLDVTKLTDEELRSGLNNLME